SAATQHSCVLNPSNSKDASKSALPNSPGAPAYNQVNASVTLNCTRLNTRAYSNSACSRVTGILPDRRIRSPSFMHIAKSSRNRGAAYSREATVPRIAACCFLALQLAFVPIGSIAGEKPSSVTAAVSSSDPVLKAMQAELARATTELAK